MKNWAGNLQFAPSDFFSPTNTEEIKAAIQKALQNKKILRMRGSGHSWTGLISTHDYFLDLDGLKGVIETNPSTQTIKAWAGTKLHQFGHEAFESGLAMENQGDINKQSLAGATSTGTHGTGITLQSIANQIESLTIIDGNGSEKIINKEHPYFHAARLSLGSLGVISDITFKLREIYKLKVESFPENFDESLLQWKKRLNDHRHLEMFYFPVGNWSLTKIMNESHDKPTSKGVGFKLNEMIVENWMYTQLNRLAVMTKQYSLIDKVIQQCVSKQVTVDWSHRAFPTERSFKFMEMEYNLPLEHFHAAIKEIREEIRKNHFQTLFPIEIRFVKSDPLWISPAFERDSVYFAVHTYISEDYKPYFDCIEKIFRKYQGRPHWGKWHSCDAKYLKNVYPKFLDFLKIREEMDPHGIFLNDHLKKIFGL